MIFFVHTYLCKTKSIRTPVRVAYEISENNSLSTFTEPIDGRCKSNECYYFTVVIPFDRFGCVNITSLCK